MKIRIAPFMLPLLLLTKCANYDLTNYHKIGEYWSCVFYDLNYLFEFNSYNDDEIFLTIKREEGFLRNNEIDNNIYVY